MAAELQGLLERIQKDGIEKAEAEAGTIVSKAQDKAAGLIKDAESKAKSILENADKDSQAFEARARKALEQAARDAVLSVHEAINATMKKIAAAEVDTIMSGSALEEMLTAVVRAYCENKGGASSIEILINPDQQKDLQNFFTAKFATEMKEGMEIKADDSIISGFKVSLKGDNVQHDFSGEAITEAMCRLLRPHLAEIVKQSQNQ